MSITNDNPSIAEDEDVQFIEGPQTLDFWYDAIGDCITIDDEGHIRLTAELADVIEAIDCLGVVSAETNN